MDKIPSMHENIKKKHTNLRAENLVGKYNVGNLRASERVPVTYR
jgi:hypothetical protein